MPDVITAIKSDHRKVEGLFGQFASATSADEKQRIVGEIVEELAKHAAAEEILVYPAVRTSRPEGGEEADHAIDEHQEIKRLLADIEKAEAGSPTHDSLVNDLEASVRHHVEEEEGSVLPTLEAGTDQERRERMGQLFEDMKPMLPTHPHPLVPGTASAQLLAGPLASVADRIRDFVSR